MIYLQLRGISEPLVVSAELTSNLVDIGHARSGQITACEWQLSVSIDGAKRYVSSAGYKSS